MAGVSLRPDYPVKVRPAASAKKPQHRGAAPPPPGSLSDEG